MIKLNLYNVYTTHIHKYYIPIEANNIDGKAIQNQFIDYGKHFHMRKRGLSSLLRYGDSNKEKFVAIANSKYLSSYANCIAIIMCMRYYEK